jgi:hypothetical protein
VTVLAPPVPATSITSGLWAAGFFRADFVLRESAIMVVPGAFEPCEFSVLVAVTDPIIFV